MNWNKHEFWLTEFVAQIHATFSFCQSDTHRWPAKGPCTEENQKH